MSDFDARMREAQRDFGEFSATVGEAISSATPVQQVLALCAFCLVLMWLMVRRPGNYEDDAGMGRQFNMALLMVIIFGLGVGSIFSDGLGGIAATLSNMA